LAKVATCFELNPNQVDGVIHAGRQAAFESQDLEILLEEYDGRTPKVSEEDYCSVLSLEP